MSEQLLRKIKERFVELGMSQYQLAKLIGFDKKTIQRMMLADNLDTFEFFTIECVLEALGLELTITCKTSSDSYEKKEKVEV